jgi:hypothetical protein
MEIPTSEPSVVTAGDTLTWRITLDDYPASAGWVLAYRLLNAAGNINITAAASGADHLVSIPAATSANWAAGDYRFTAWVTKSAERYTIKSGNLTVRPNVAALTTLDDRSPERRALEALQAAYITYLSNDQGHVAEYEIAGRKMKFRSAAEIWMQIERLKIEVSKQDTADRLAAGLPTRRRLLVRFN